MRPFPFKPLPRTRLELEAEVGIECRPRFDWVETNVFSRNLKHNWGELGTTRPNNLNPLTDSFTDSESMEKAHGSIMSAAK